MKSHWYVVGDASGARVLLNGGESRTFELLQTLPNSAGRARNQELVTDKPGRVDTGGNRSRCAVEPPVSPHEHEVERFAHSLSELLDAAALFKQYDSLTLIFPPAFLGQLRLRLTSGVRAKLTNSIPKDLTHLNLHSLAEYLREHVMVAA